MTLTERDYRATPRPIDPAPGTGELCEIALYFVAEAERGGDGLTCGECEDALADIRQALADPDLVARMARAAWNVFADACNKTGYLSFAHGSGWASAEKGQDYSALTDPESRLRGDDRRLADRLAQHNRSRKLDRLPALSRLGNDGEVA